MLSIFPQFLNYGLFGVFLIRLTVSLVLLYIGLITVGVKKDAYEMEMKIHGFPFPRLIPIFLGVTEIIVGLFLLIGFLTQLMVLIAIYLFINLIFIEKYAAKIFNYPNMFYVVMIMVSLSVLFLGPGAFSLDLPL